MQFKGKLMNQTFKIKEALILGLILTHLTQIWAPKTFFAGYTSASS